MPARIVVASNRGPVSFAVDDATLALTVRRGGGGMVSAVTEAAADATVWVCAALGDGDREAVRRAPAGRIDRAGHDTGGIPVRMLDIDPTTFHRAYNAVANSTLWFISHLLYDTARRPVFDARFAREWAGYVDYNRAFADALAEEAGERARVLVQDYHLMLVPGMLRDRRQDLSIAHFTHTPWAPPDYFALLPDDVAEAVITGMLGADHVGFLSHRWAAAFRDCAVRVSGVDADGDLLRLGDRSIRVGVHPLGVSAQALRARAGAADVVARLALLRERVGDRRVLVRVDRTELSKNIVRGLAAYRELLRNHPEWRGQVVHLVFAYPSRHDLPEYREYTAAIQRVVQEIEDEFATPDWAPVLLEVSDDFARSLAGYRIADVLVVNPVRDGMNLVAKEGPVLSERNLALVLSRETGAAEELGADALLVNPFDVSATAAALHLALVMPAADRAARCGRLAAAATRLPPAAWLGEQLDALDAADAGGPGPSGPVSATRRSARRGIRPRPWGRAAPGRRRR